MSDKKNFSTLGRIDERYVEEAAAFSVAPAEKTSAAPKRHTARRWASRFALLAAGVAVVCAGYFALSPLFSPKNAGEANKGEISASAPNGDGDADSGAGDASRDDCAGTEGESSGESSSGCSASEKESSGSSSSDSTDNKDSGGNS